MRIVIRKAARRLDVLAGGAAIFSCPIALGASPIGPKARAGDGKTTEGAYFVCEKKRGKFGPSLGVSYPNERDARFAGADKALIACIRERAARLERPPWGTFLGGEIFIHGGGADRDWTAGCVALSDPDAEALYDLVPTGTPVQIMP